MARGNAKKAKVAKSSFEVGTTAFSSADSGSSLPSNFEPISARLSPITKYLPESHVSLVHVEQTPSALRRQAFMVPVMLNTLIVIVLICRLYYALPIYLNQMVTIMGYETPWTVKTEEMTWKALFKILSYRTLLLSLDYAMFGVLGRWPYEFIFGDKYGQYVSCLAWKWEMGFQRPQEVIVRRGRHWDSLIFASKEVRASKGMPKTAWTKDEELLAFTKCTFALSSAQTSKNALSLLDRDWDLDYASMVDLTDLIDAGKVSYSDIDCVAFVRWQDKWFYWAPHKAIEDDKLARNSAESDAKVDYFRKCLVQINCEDVFYRWIEILQYETNQPQGFTSDRKEKAEQELREMIKARGKDDEKLFNQVGGRVNIPGLDNKK